MSNLIRALAELREARDDYDLAESFYYGRREEQFAGRLISKHFQNATNNFSVNFAGRPVDAVIDRLEITAVTTENEVTTTILNEFVWSANELALEAPEVLKKTTMLGDSYLYVGPGDDKNTVEIFYNSPKSVRIFYDSENPRRKSYAIKAWVEKDGFTRVNLYYPDHTEKYVSRTNSKMEKEEDFDAYIDETTDENGHVDNEFGQIPFFHFRTERPYGRPEHANAFGPQDALTKLVINQMTTSEFSVFPQRWAIEDTVGETMDDFDYGDDNTEGPGSDRVDPSQFQAGPGNVWLLKNIKQMGEFSAANAQNFLEPMNWYVRSMSSSCSTPLHYFDPIGDAPSGESLRALEAPLVKKVRARQVSYAATWREALMFALRILGITVQQVNVQWANPQVMDDLTSWQAVNEKIRAGVPKRQALMDSGYTESQVNSWGYTSNTPDGEGEQTDV